MSKKKRKGVKYTRQMFPKKMKKKLVVLFITIMLAFLVLVGSVLYITFTNGRRYQKIVLNQQRYDSTLLPFKRGDILDRNGSKMATSERVYNVILDAKVLLSEKGKKTEKEIAEMNAEELKRLREEEKERKKYIKKTKKAVEECFGITGEEVDKVLKENPKGSYTIMKRGVSFEQAQTFKERSTPKKDEKGNLINTYIRGVWLESDYLRKYPYNTLASDVIGFTSAGNVGNAGIELAYNDALNGIDGREYGYQGADFSLERVVKPAVDGKTVVSTIDITLQSIVEKHMQAFNEEHKGEVDKNGEGSLNTAVIIANPNTGEILAEASYPKFDLNNPKNLENVYTPEKIQEWLNEVDSAGNSVPEEKKMLEIQNKLWRNFCVSDTFEPGSVMKPFTVAAGLETGKLTGEEVYNCTGALKIPGYPNPVKCHKLDGHGPQTVEQAIANSCNVALMHMAETIGVEEFVKYQEIFGFDKKTGIDLPGEAKGLLFPAEDMKMIDLATCSFGQSFTVSATQMVAAFSSLINGGNYYEPYVVKQILDENGNVIENRSPVLVRKTISEETGEKLKTYMRTTMTEGTGKNAQVEGYDIGAKTGTAQKIPRSSGKHLLSYMGFAPVDQPEVLVYVIIDEPNVENQANSKLVTDLARNIMTEAFPYLNITKAAPAEDAGSEAAE